jgi:plastocyanin
MPEISRRMLLLGGTAVPIAALLPDAGLSAQSGSDPSGSGQTARTYKINIRNSAFSPARVTLKAGDRVTWRNRDSLPHTATDQGGGWDTGDLPGKKSVTITFSTPGTYDYVCRYHPNMRATVVVQG